MQRRRRMSAASAGRNERRGKAARSWASMYIWKHVATGVWQINQVSGGKG
jgi:hypothetical protein